MGIFSTSPAESLIDAAIDEDNLGEDWSQIMAVCDEIKNSPTQVNDFYKAIMRKMNSSNPHVVLQALNLMDVCVINCGDEFKMEIASKHFENEYTKLMNRFYDNSHIMDCLKLKLHKWATEDFASNRNLSLIPRFYDKLRSKGLEIDEKLLASSRSAVPGLGRGAGSTSSKLATLPKDPNIVVSQEEEEDVIKAIELSLRETKLSRNDAVAATTSASQSLYPSLSVPTATSASTATSANAGSTTATKAKAEPRKVRALYDFEATDENEITFKAGEIIHVLEECNEHWWSGSNHRGNGLFPSSFVTSDLTLDVTAELENKATGDNSNQNQQSLDPDVDDSVSVRVANKDAVEIDETKIDRLMCMFHEADTTNIGPESDELLQLEDEVYKMGPLIDAELEKVDRKNAELTKLSADLVQAFNMYHTLMKVPQSSTATLPRSHTSAVSAALPTNRFGSAFQPPMPMAGTMPRFSRNQTTPFSNGSVGEPIFAYPNNFGHGMHMQQSPPSLIQHPMHGYPTMMPQYQQTSSASNVVLMQTAATPIMTPMQTQSQIPAAMSFHHQPQQVQQHQQQIYQQQPQHLPQQPN